MIGKSNCIPTSEQCLAILEEYNVTEHIRLHCRKVAEVAVFIAKQLLASGAALDIALIEAAALLHDITKIEALRQGGNHAETGAKLIAALGFPAVADVVKEHIHLSQPVTGTPINEAQLVNYADKRVLHTTLVSLADRFDYIREKYGSGGLVAGINRINAIEEEMRGLEKKIFSCLPISPEDIPT